jgi:hypothetical protein
MTDKELDRLRSLANAATPGPWKVGTPEFRCKLSHWPHGQGKCRYTFNGWNDLETEYISRDVAYGPDDVIVKDSLIAGQLDCDFGGVANEADAAYIAAVHPQRILALLDEIDTLKKKVGA